MKQEIQHIRSISQLHEIFGFGKPTYDVHEALHLSDAEQKTMTDCRQMIQNEIQKV